MRRSASSILTVDDLKAQAITNTLFSPTTLGRAIERIGFVQADPIRSPARAQDLILRHRVSGYRAGDLERRYPKLDLEEDFLYAYGFMPQSTWRLLHPRVSKNLSAMEQRVCEVVSKHKQIHPRELEAYLGKKREINAWGGYSKATTRALQHLHFRGLLRIAKRENGIRLYEPARAPSPSMAPEDRLRQLIVLIARILGPVPERSLRTTLHMTAKFASHLRGRYSMIEQLVEAGQLSAAKIDSIRYLWPPNAFSRKNPESRVRFLAPFDPLVWDRRRFEHLWGWRYRFEAYTPVDKRVMGYYALPVLWRSDVVGWVNISARAGELVVKAGYAHGEPTEPEFGEQFDLEVARFKTFLTGRSG